MSDIVYRDATVADVAGILALWRGFWAPQPYEVNLESKIRDEPEMVCLAEVDGEIVGTVIGGFDGWWAWLYRIAVAPALQNRGIATHLVGEMQARLRSRGATGVAVIVSEENAAIRRVLERLGYTDRGYKMLGRPLR